MTNRVLENRNAPPTPFSSLLKRASRQPGALELELPPDWLQGRSAFGGLQAALALWVMRSLVPDQRALRSLQTNFIAPLAGHVRAEARVLRTGKNTTQLEAKLLGPEGLSTQVLGVFGAKRESEVREDISPSPLPTTVPVAFPFLPGVTPEFTQHFQMGLLKGEPPFRGIHTNRASYQLSMRDDGPCTEAHVIAFADVAPPLAMSALTKPTFGSTLSWLLELIETPCADTSLDAWRLDVELVSARDGYTNQSCVLWSPDERPIALSHQTMLVFD